MKWYKLPSLTGMKRITRISYMESIFGQGCNLYDVHWILLRTTYRGISRVVAIGPR